MKFTDILKNMVEQAGVPVTEATIKAILDNPAVAAFEVDDAVSTRLTAPRLTMDAAKANPDLKNYYRKQVFDGGDSELSKLITELQLPDEVKTGLDAQDTFFKKIPYLVKEVQKLEASKVGATKKDKDTLTIEIDKLNAQIAAEKNGFATEKQKLLDGFEVERIGSEVNSILSTFKYPLPENTPDSTRTVYGRSFIEPVISEKGLKIVRKDGALALQTSEGTDYFENNVKVGVKDFIQKTLANAKALSASAPAAPAPQTPAFTPQGQNGHAPVNSQSFMSSLDSEIAAASQQ